MDFSKWIGIEAGFPGSRREPCFKYPCSPSFARLSRNQAYVLTLFSSDQSVFQQIGTLPENGKYIDNLPGAGIMIPVLRARESPVVHPGTEYLTPLLNLPLSVFHLSEEPWSNPKSSF
jgi:hypothetical protein